jgi:branched-subunit amino acid aminotransferase/4-amino-4-deoxychorismate lyase
MVLSPTTRNILPGISRQTVIELCGELNIPFGERDLQIYDAINADEAFLASTPYCLAPVSRINGVTIGDGKRASGAADRDTDSVVVGHRAA